MDKEIGVPVSWKWGKGHGYGLIKKQYDYPIVLTIKGKQIKRNGTSTDPACLIEQKNGNQVLKLSHELTRL